MFQFYIFVFLLSTSSLIQVFCNTVANDACSRELCQFWNFKCSSRGCLNMMRFCDGHIDCPDGSDEMEITHANKHDVVLCNNLLNSANKSCLLPSKYQCDGIQHCFNSTDENHELCGNKSRYLRLDYVDAVFMNKQVLNCPECKNSTRNCQNGYCEYDGNDVEDLCASSIYRCKNNQKCLKASQFCDGIVDCLDGSDEIATMETEDGILCSNNWNFVDKKCFLDPFYFCDGINHCQDRVDECQDNCKYSLICNNSRCIPSGYNLTAPYFVNDDDDNCGDGSDQVREESFLCNDIADTRIAYERFCDGVVDCPNEADEQYFAEGLRNESEIYCQNIRHHLNRSCLVPPHHLCDKHVLCKDHKDEALQCDNITHFVFQCANGDHIESNGFETCDLYADCCDDTDECSPDLNCDNTFTCDDGKCLAFSRFCDGFVDCADGSDERSGNGSVTANSCNNHYNLVAKWCILPEKYHCDGIEHCMHRLDECSRGCKHSFTCADNSNCIPIENFCDGFAHCDDMSDEQVNGAGFKCDVKNKVNSVKIETKTCVLPQVHLQNGYDNCDDKSDEKNTSIRCYLHNTWIARRQLCDGKYDCPDYSDECLCDYELTAVNKSFICENLCLESVCGKCNYGEVSWESRCLTYMYKDIFSNDNFSKFTKKTSLKQNRNNELTNTNDDFFCKNMDDKTVLYSKCDGIVECYNFSDECDSQCNTSIYKICSKIRHNNHLTYCSSADNTLLTERMVCDGIEDCAHSDGPFNSSRSWEDLSVDERYCTEFRALCFQSAPRAEKQVSLLKHQFCDGIIDCRNDEDEARKTCDPDGKKRFYCEKRKTKQDESCSDCDDNDPLFVDRNSMFDGKKDCWDGSDECPSSLFEDDPIASRHRMIKDASLSVIVWLTAILALIGNLCVIWRTFVIIYRKRRLSSMMKTNYILVLNLAISDFLMGVYLFVLAIENAKTNGTYCSVDKEWRSSIECNVLGTLAMTSIQCSVLVLMILTTYRVVVVLNPFSADSLSSRYAGALVMGAWLVSFSIALLPHSNSLKNYFVSSVSIKISSKVEFFSSDNPSISTMKLFMERLIKYNSSKITSNQIGFNKPYEASAEWMNQILQNSYPESWPQLEVVNVFGFYSSNSVCLPKIFVTTNDTSWEYSLGIIIFDFIAFFYIFVSYVIIYYDATQVGATARNDDENRTMQTRITRLVLTDFISWIPVCTMTFLKATGVEIPSVAYTFAAIILLPINSALNPILYSNIISDILENYFKRLRNFIGKRVRMGRESINRAYHRSYFSRASTAVSLVTNDHMAQQEGIPMLRNGANTATSHNSTSTTTTTTRI